jgi:hypothetical protein
VNIISYTRWITDVQKRGAVSCTHKKGFVARDSSGKIIGRYPFNGEPSFCDDSEKVRAHIEHSIEDKNLSLAMRKVKDRVVYYNIVRIIFSLAILIAAPMLLIEANDLLHPIATVIFALIAFKIIIFVQAISLQRIASLRCPGCNKPILTKASAFDQNLKFLAAYDKCPFCGLE